MSQNACAHRSKAGANRDEIGGRSQGAKTHAGPGKRESKTTIWHHAGRTSERNIRASTALLVAQARAYCGSPLPPRSCPPPSHAAREGFIEGDPYQAPAVRLALPVQPPFGGPSEIRVAPDE